MKFWQMLKDLLICSTAVVIMSAALLEVVAVVIVVVAVVVIEAAIVVDVGIETKISMSLIHYRGHFLGA